MSLTLAALASADGPLEIVERKGLGHPDTLCDEIAEAASRALCRAYVERCGRVLHHNVDKVLLRGGSAHAAFGGGEVLAPIEIHIAGRATARCGDTRVPLDEIVHASTRAVLERSVPELDAARHVRLVAPLRPGSADLAELFERAADTAPLANDTSCGVGYAPLSPLERAVLAVEHGLQTGAAHPERGSDIKIMAVREGSRVELTVGCAFVGRHLRDLDAYLAGRDLVAADARRLAAEHLADADVRVTVNAADDPARGSVYLTVTGTSAEAGDDGEAGRGNRGNGLITPLRPMTMESIAGKNPISHVGKLYNLVAPRLAAALVERLAEVTAARCYLVSRIGRPIDEPQCVHLELHRADGRAVEALRARIEPVVAEHLDALRTLWRESIAEPDGPATARRAR